MSLLKKRRMTPANLEAHRRNARRSRGPASAGGLKHSRGARLRHGFYSRAEETGLRALGEDPGDFLRVVEALRAKWSIADDAEDRLLLCLARALWRIDRADRIREGHTLRLAREAEEGRESRLHAQIMRLRMTSECLRRFAAPLINPYYVACPDDLKKVQSFREDGALKEMGDVVVALFFELREPGTPGMGEPDAGESPEVQQRRVLRRVKEIFGLVRDEPDPEANSAPPETATAAETAPPDEGQEDRYACARYPNITHEQWEARQPVRQLLINMLVREAELFEARQNSLLKELVKGPTPFERAAEITPTSPHATLMQRLEDSNLRQASRLLELLGKMRVPEDQPRDVNGRWRGRAAQSPKAARR